MAPGVDAAETPHAEINKTDPDRAEFTAALRELADYLDAHDVPVPPYDNAYIHAFPAGGDDDERRADVDRIAGVLGVAAADNDDGSHRIATLTFGGRVRYVVAAITDSYMQKFEAYRSYRGAVRP